MGGRGPDLHKMDYLYLYMQYNNITFTSLLSPSGKRHLVVGRLGGGRDRAVDGEIPSPLVSLVRFL